MENETNFAMYLKKLTNEAEDKEIIQAYKDDLSSAILERLTQAASMGLARTILRIHEIKNLYLDDLPDIPAKKRFPHGNDYNVTDTETTWFANKILTDLGFAQQTNFGVDPIYKEAVDARGLDECKFDNPYFYQDYDRHHNPVLVVIWGK